MTIKRVLNLYAGLGGNRKYWPRDIQVTAVEINPEIASIYSTYFPNDTIIVGDAHQYLLDHYQEFDFIWSSFPCTTHTRMNVNFGLVRYPDLGLYQEIILLHTFFKGKFCVENVLPYYTLIIPEVPVQQLGRHLFWANFKIQKPDINNSPPIDSKVHCPNTKRKRKAYDGVIVNIKSSQPRFGFDLAGVKIKSRKDTILRNLVDPEIGRTILESASNSVEHNFTQISLF